jgi:hypothetical protein
MILRWRAAAAAFVALALLGSTGHLITPALAGDAGPADGMPAGAATALASGDDSSAATPPPEVRTGDLMHLVYTARTGLVAALLAPAADAVVGTTVAKASVQTVEGAGVELSVGGSVVPASQLGERAVDSAEHTARYTYYAVRFAPGPNDVAVTALGADGLRGVTVHYRVYGAGKPVAVHASISGRLVADGRTPATLSIAATDALGHSAQADSQVIVSVGSGAMRLALPGDEHPAGTNAVKLRLDANGRARVILLPGATSGNVRLTVVTGDAKTSVGAFVEPLLRPAFVTGLVSAGLGSTPGDEDGDGNLDDGGSRRGRVALFGSGEAFDRVSLTFAYDTASRLAPQTTTGPFVADPADRPYQTYGDESTQHDDAVSRSRLYARVEDGHDAFTFGEFTADLGAGDTSATSYHQLLNGAQLQLADGNERVRTTLFSAANDVAYARQTFPVSGLATLAAPLAPNIVIGSDVITLVTLDRRTGAAIAQTVLQPNVDYVLDYSSGQLRFIQVPLPFDSALDPNVIVVQYQYTGGGLPSRTTGGSSTLRLGPSANAATLRVGYVNDVTGAGNFSILEGALTGPLRGGAWSLVHATAAGLDANGSSLTDGYGASTRFALTNATRGLRLNLGYDQTGAGYQNPFGGFATPGLTDMRLLLAHPLHDDGEVALSFTGQANRGLGSDTAQSDASLAWKQRYHRLTLHSAIDVRRQNTPATPAGLILPTPAPDGSIPALLPGALAPAGPAIVSTATQATAGLEYRIAEKSTLSLTRIQDVGGAPDSSLAQPSQTLAGLDLALDATTHAYLRSVWSGAPQVGFAESSAAYTAESGTHATTFGIDHTVGPDTTLTSQWALQNTGGATDVYATNGVRERLRLSTNLKGDAFFQTSQADGAAASGGEFSVYGMSLAYGGGSFHASGAFQNRVGFSPGFDLQLGAGGALSPDLSLLGHLDDAVTAGFENVDARLGLAWRPQRDDRGASLLELERQTGNLTDGVERADTLSFDEAYRPTSRLEVDGRLAYKLDGDAYYAAHSELVGLRVAQRIGSRNDIAVETRTLRVPGIAGATQTGFALESGVRIADALRFAAGYNFSGAADPSLFAAPTRRGAYVTLTSVVDHVFGWGR